MLGCQDPGAGLTVALVAVGAVISYLTLRRAQDQGEAAAPAQSPAQVPVPVPAPADADRSQLAGAGRR